MIDEIESAGPMERSAKARDHVGCHIALGATATGSA